MLTFSKSCLGITEMHNNLVYKQRAHAWGSEGVAEGHYPHQGGVSTQIQCPQVSVIWEKLDTFRVAWILHSSLGKLSYRNSKHSWHLCVLVFRWITKQRYYSCSDWPSFSLMNYIKAFIHSHKLMLLFGDMLFLTRSTMFNSYSMKGLIYILSLVTLKQMTFTLQYSSMQ